MNLVGKCEGCKKLKLFIRKREFKTPAVSVKSQSNLCGMCARNIQKMLIQ